MRRHLNYGRTVLEHKWFVLVAGLRMGRIPIWRLLAHDLSKLSRHEWPAYSRRYAVRGRPGPSTPEWEEAWDHHVRHNEHHWEHWVIRNAGDKPGQGTPLAMPAVATREMVADWMAAGRAYTGRWDAPSWYRKNIGRIRLHPVTRKRVESLLSRIERQPIWSQDDD